MKKGFGRENMMVGDKDIAIIILNYNSWELTIDFVEEQISKLHKPSSSRIIIIDNNSTNDSAEQLEKWNNKKNMVKIILSDKNSGYAAGNNIGLKWAYSQGYKYAWVLNNDVLFKDSNTLMNLVDIFKNDEMIGVVSPRVFTPSGMETNRNLFRPSVFDFTLGKIKYRKIGRTIPASLRGNVETYCYNYRPQGCCMLIDLDKLHDVDYLDEYTFLYMEELILAERMLQKGIKSACCLNTKVIHNHSTTVNSVAKRKQIYKWHHESEMYYYTKYRNFNSMESMFCGVFTWVYYYFVRQIKKFN